MRKKLKVADEKEMKIEESNDNDARNNINEEESVSTDCHLDIGCHKQEKSVSNIIHSSCVRFVKRSKFTLNPVIY